MTTENLEHLLERELGAVTKAIENCGWWDPDKSLFLITDNLASIASSLDRIATVLEYSDAGRRMKHRNTAALYQSEKEGDAVK